MPSYPPPVIQYHSQLEIEDLRLCRTVIADAEEAQIADLRRSCRRGTCRQHSSNFPDRLRHNFCAVSALLRRVSAVSAFRPLLPSSVLSVPVLFKALRRVSARTTA